MRWVGGATTDKDSVERHCLRGELRKFGVHALEVALALDVAATSQGVEGAVVAAHGAEGDVDVEGGEGLGHRAARMVARSMCWRMAARTAVGLRSLSSGR